MVSLLRSAYQQGKLFQITQDNEVNKVLDEVMSKKWSIYIKPYLEHPETVVKYLSRYTYRIAISNSRIIRVDEQSVCFHWKDYADNNRKKIMILEGLEFLRRFLMYVLPNGFMRIRHFGFLANCVRQVRVTLLRQLLKITGSLPRIAKAIKSCEPEKLTCLCPACHQGNMRSLYQIPSLKHRRQLLA